jgi:hypothetical protein
MKNARIALQLVFSFLSLCANAHPAALQSEAGTIEGIVTRTGSTEGIPNVKVTLSSGPTDPTTLRALVIAAAPSQATVAAASSPATAATPVSDADILQSVLDSASANGRSPGNASLTIALNNFRDQTAKYRTMTDGSGRFVLSDIPPGQYTVRSERDGYFGTHGTTATVTVVSNKTAAASLSMVQGATVGGTIRDEDGEPLANATVEIFQIIYPNGYPTIRAAVTAKTNFRGEYRLFWMPAGEYVVGASREVNATQGARVFYPGTHEFTTAMPISLKPGEDKDRIDFVLTSARMIRVTGVMTSTVPLPPKLLLPLLRTGDQLTSEQQLSIAASYGWRNELRLELVSRTPDFPEVSDYSEVAIVALKENRAQFEFTAPSGTYDLVGVLPSVGTGKVPLDLRDTDITGVALTIQPQVTIKGTLVSTGAAPDFTKLRVSEQATSRFDVLLAAVVGSSISQTPAKDGSFSLPWFVNNRMHTMVQALPPNMYVADIRQDGTSVLDSGFDVTEDTPPIQIILSSDGGSVMGSVVDTFGKPLSKAILVLVPPQARRTNRAAYIQSTSDNNGRFTINNVPPGEYKLFAWPSGMPNGSYYNATFLARFEERGRTITIGPLTPVSVDGITVPFD